MDQYTVYVLYSKFFHKIYIGFTSNLISRFHSHSTLSKLGYTKRYRPWIVAYTEYFTTKEEAYKREKELKSAKGREFIWNYIKGHN